MCSCSSIAKDAIKIFSNDLIIGNHDSLTLFGIRAQSSLKEYSRRIATISLKELIQCGFCKENATICHSLVKRINKAYPIYTNGYYELYAVEEWIDKIIKLQCIGKNGQHRYNNMNHAVEMGFIATRNIIDKVYDRKQTWNVNTDKEYLEGQ